jgi:hypothetical protein
MSFVVFAWLQIPLECLGFARLPAQSGSITTVNWSEDFGDRNVLKLNDTDHLALLGSDILRDHQNHEPPMSPATILSTHFTRCSHGRSRPKISHCRRAFPELFHGLG